MGRDHERKVSFPRNDKEYKQVTSQPRSWEEEHQRVILIIN